MSNVHIMKDEIEALRNELEKLIDNNSDDSLTHETILMISCRLDEMIVTYLKLKLPVQ